MSTATVRLPRAARNGLAVVPVVVWIAALVVGPSLILIINSLRKSEIFGVTKTATLENYQRIVESETVLTLLWRSLLIATGAATLATLVAFPLAYVVARYFGRRRFVAAVLILVPLWVSFLMRVFSWKLILGDNGILNGFLTSTSILAEPSDAFLYSPWAVAIAMTYVGIPYVFLCAYALLERIPPNLYEAAGDCGASPWRALRTVIWPIARPGVVVGYMLVFVIVFGDYVTPTLVGGFNGTMIGSVVLQAFGGLNDPPYGAALSVFIVAWALVVLGAASILLRKRYVLEGETS